VTSFSWKHAVNAIYFTRIMANKFASKISWELKYGELSSKLQGPQSTLDNPEHGIKYAGVFLCPPKASQS
jgi:hypothetical protein